MGEGGGEVGGRGAEEGGQFSVCRATQAGCAIKDRRCQHTSSMPKDLSNTQRPPADLPLGPFARGSHLPLPPQHNETHRQLLPPLDASSNQATRGCH